MQHRRYNLRLEQTMKGGESNKRQRWNSHEDWDQETLGSQADCEKQEPTEDKLCGYSIPKVAKGEKKKNPLSNVPEKDETIQGETKINYHSANRNRPHLRWTMKYDKPLPQQILDKCREKECQLCGVKFTGPAHGEQHYEGTKHGKKVVVDLENIFSHSPDEPRPKKQKSDWSPTICSQTDLFLANLADNIKVPLTPRQVEQKELWEPPLPMEIVVMIKERSCNVCNVPLTSHSMATSHFNGRPHDKKIVKVLESLGLTEVHRKKVTSVQSESDTSCSLCKVEFTGASSAVSHYAGVKHKKMLEANKKGFFCGGSGEEEDRSFGIGTAFSQGSAADKEPKKKLEGDINVAKKVSPYFCLDCKIDCMTETPYKMHMLGKNHLRKVNLNKDGMSATAGKLMCNVCNVSCTDENALQMHINGKQHAKKMRLLGEDKVSLREQE